MKKSPVLMKISSACKTAAKKKFDVWPSAYASGWGVLKLVVLVKWERKRKSNG